MALAPIVGLNQPEGQKLQFLQPSMSLKIGTIIAFCITYSIATIFMALRYFQAFKLTKKIEIDLVIITTSYGVALIHSVTMIILMYHGQDVSLTELVEFSKQLLISTLAYLICPCITKMAILTVLFQINPTRVYRYIIVAVVAAILTYTLALCIITGGPCSPLHLGTKVCLQKVALSHAVLNIVSDFAVITIPIPTIHALHSSKKQKITVGCLLALGSSVVICSIARVPYMLHYGNTADSTNTEAVIGIWSMFEINLGIICACAMRLKGLISTYLSRFSLFSPRAIAKLSEEAAIERFQPKGERARHSYQLHSIQVGNYGPFKGTKHISVHQAFRIDEERPHVCRGDNDSAERILP
ncbi:hypothetical protein N7537_010028 [Penicillium hordei]|uniref:Rhodopsin domain-containing protein n=1 Tax=Penicillium hordei TaxID=40994 RepID=A0AAD6DVA5_9EURO|nr:uncharacterized protein N7537_010028 [Penicillium hordei]KAJ5593124.1 hypothetical protein N7537_010028 [Penicillium hordei]